MGWHVSHSTPVPLRTLSRYPDENDYDAFLTAHGGASNACTEEVRGQQAAAAVRVQSLACYETPRG